jgi:hypothetical protein
MDKGMIRYVQGVGWLGGGVSKSRQAGEGQIQSD